MNPFWQNPISYHVLVPLQQWSANRYRVPFSSKYDAGRLRHSSWLEVLEASGTFRFCLSPLPGGTVESTSGRSLICNCKRPHYPWGQDTEQGSRIERNVLSGNRVIYLKVRLCLLRIALLESQGDAQSRTQKGADRDSSLEVGVSALGQGCRVQQVGAGGAQGCLDADAPWCSLVFSDITDCLESVSPPLPPGTHTPGTACQSRGRKF